MYMNKSLFILIVSSFTLLHGGKGTKSFANGRHSAPICSNTKNNGAESFRNKALSVTRPASVSVVGYTSTTQPKKTVITNSSIETQNTPLEAIETQNTSVETQITNLMLSLGATMSSFMQENNEMINDYEDRLYELQNTINGRFSIYRQFGFNALLKKAAAEEAEYDTVEADEIEDEYETDEVVDIVDREESCEALFKTSGFHAVLQKMKLQENK